jgi:hypothetical protein
VAEKELNLLQLAPADVAQLRARPPQIVRREMIKLHSLRTVPNYVPDHVFRYSFAPRGSVPADCPKDSTICNIRCLHPSVDSVLHPDRHRNRADMAALSDKVNYGPVPLTDLDVLFPEGHQFRSSESATQQGGNHGHIAGGTEALAIRFLKERASLIAIEPVADPAPICFTPLTILIPAASSGLSSPESAAS